MRTNLGNVPNSPVTPTARIRATGNHLVAQNDEPEPGDLTPADVDEEVRRIEADHHYNQLKNSGELQRRRDAYAHRHDDPWSRR